MAGKYSNGTGREGRRGARRWPAFLAAALVLVGVWVAFHRLGFFFTVQKDGGWTRQTAVVDFGIKDRSLLPNAAAAESSPEVDSLIILLADGLGLSHVTAARAQLVGINGLLSFERFPVTRWLDTHAVDSVYSDSASNATAIATGRKTSTGYLGVDASGSPLPSLFDVAEAAGKATGWVTDSYFFDASPAAFAVETTDRREYADIVAQIAAGGWEFVAGEEREDYPQDDAARKAMHGVLEAAGWRVATSWAEAMATDDDPRARLAAVFAPGSVADDDSEPRLTELFDMALRRLAAHDGGFVLLAETEDPDSGSHNGDFSQVLRGVRHLDALARRALEFARQDERTLVVVTSDHESGGLTLITGGPDDRLGIRWATTNHTGQPVPLFAWGPGAEVLLGARDNTDLAPRVAGLLGLSLSLPNAEAAGQDREERQDQPSSVVPGEAAGGSS